MLNNKIYIYAIYFPTSDKYYIGMTNNLRDRMFRHLRSDHLVGRALRKHEDWQISVLHIRTEKEEAKLLEIENIRNFNCIHPNGYNQTRGGDGLAGYWKGRKRSAENNENNRKAQLGKKHSEDHKKNIGIKSKEYHNRPEVRRQTAEFMRERMKGNTYFQGHTHSKEFSGNLIKRNKENNPMNDPKAKLKWKISRLRTSIEKLEKVGD